MLNAASPHDNTSTLPPQEVVTLLSWYAASRPYRKRKREYFINALLIVTALEIIIFLFHQYLLMLVVIALVFLAFALAIVPPHPIYYKISNQGVQVDQTFYIWEELYDFYFMRRFGQDVLHIRTQSYYPGELTVVLGDVSVDQIKSTLLHFLPFREYVEPTFMDKAANWMERTLPLES